MKELKVVKETEILGKKILLYDSVENPLFNAKDVAEWIEERDGYTVARKVDEDEKLLHTICVSGQNRETTMLTEDGLYEACMQSRKPIAKEMKKQIKLYLKQIRLTGGYIPIEENDSEEVIMAKALKIADKTIQEKDAIISSLTPKAKAYDDLINTKGYMTLKEVGDLIEIGRNTLCGLLISKKVMSKQERYNIPLGKYIKNGYFKLIAKSDDKGHVSTVPLVSPKGLDYIYKLIKKNNMLDEFNATSLLEVVNA